MVVVLSCYDLLDCGLCVNDHGCGWGVGGHGMILAPGFLSILLLLGLYLFYLVFYLLDLHSLVLPHQINVGRRGIHKLRL